MSGRSAKLCEREGEVFATMAQPAEDFLLFRACTSNNSRPLVVEPVLPYIRAYVAARGQLLVHEPVEAVRLGRLRRVIPLDYARRVGTEIVALIGVAAGALLNGGAQTLQRERERRVHARVAARLFLGDLVRAEDDLGRVIEGGRWPDINMPTYVNEVDVRAAQRQAFAAVVNAAEWTIVAVAYQDLVDLPAQSEPGRPFTAAERHTLSRVRQRIDEAYEVAAKRAAPVHQRARAAKKLAASKERPPAG